MKKFQKTCTTQEQSQRLLQLGIPIDSADFYLNDLSDMRAFELERKYSETDWSRKYELPTPSWSVGRLIEIWEICVHLFPGMELTFYPDCKILEQIIERFEYEKCDGLVDLSRLEEYL